jgi:uncharacterized protein affecting Mg2+/Co2+ transport
MTVLRFLSSSMSSSANFFFNQQGNPFEASIPLFVLQRPGSLH